MEEEKPEEKMEEVNLDPNNKINLTYYCVNVEMRHTPVSEFLGTDF